MKGIIIDDDTKDLLVRRGSLVIDDNRADIAERLLIMWRGEYKERPTFGGEVKKMIAGELSPFWNGDVRSQLAMCLVPVRSLELQNGTVALVVSH